MKVVEQTDQEKAVIQAEYYARIAAGENAESVGAQVQTIIEGEWRICPRFHIAPTWRGVYRWRPKTKWVVRGGEIPKPCTDVEALGIKTNRGSTNWYVSIGDMLVAGCQIHYAIKCSRPSGEAITLENIHEGKVVKDKSACSRIYMASN